METLRQSNIVPLPAPAKPSEYEGTQHTNIVRSKATGMLFIKATVRGHSVKKSLNTKSIEIALGKRDALLEWARRKFVSRADKTRYHARSFSTLVDRYRVATMTNPDLRPSSKQYRLELVDTILGTSKIPCLWSALLEETPVERLTVSGFAELADKLRAKYSAVRYNALIGALRAILKPAVEQGVFMYNPITEGLDKGRIRLASVVIEDKGVPTLKQLDALFRELKPKGERYTKGARHSPAYFWAKFLRHFSLRIGTARKLTLAMVHRDAKEFHIPGELVKWGVKGKIYRVPIFPAMEGVLKELDNEYGKERELVLPEQCAPTVLKSACKKVGIEPYLTWHDFRHVFTTYAILATKDPILCSKWRCDKDGGVMMLKRYSHLVDEHSRRMALKLK